MNDPVRTHWTKALRWLPAVGWMLVIYAASSDTASAARSSRILGPLVRFLFPEISEDALATVMFAGRKVAHLTVYAVLALLVGFAYGDRRPGGHARSGAGMGRVLLVVVLYALFDEFHQTLVPNRQGSILDVAIDTLGGLVGGWLFVRIRHWKKGVDGHRSRPDERLEPR